MSTGPGHRAHARVDLSALRHNVATLVQRAAPAQVMIVVKADAYGHGAAPVARAAREAGATWLGVAFTDEAVALRQAGDRGRLLAWLLAPGDRIQECINADVDLSASAPWTLLEIATAARESAHVARVHLAVDTGLGREGARESHWDELFEAAAIAQRDGDIRVVGLWSHLAQADEIGAESVDMQAQAFARARQRAAAAGLTPEVCHLANSAATLTRPDLHHDLVRVGIAAYGITPNDELGDVHQWDLLPVMSMRTRLSLVKAIPAGAGVSYGLEWRAARHTHIGLIPVGYGDGVPRQATHHGLTVSIGDRVYPVIGRICMDQVMVDLGPDPVAHVGDEVICFGAGVAPSAQQWGLAAGTIGYDIVTRIGSRLHRHYVEAR